MILLNKMSFIKDLPFDNKQHNSSEKNELIDLIFENSDKSIINTNEKDNHNDVNIYDYGSKNDYNLENYESDNDKNLKSEKKIQI